MPKVRYYFNKCILYIYLDFFQPVIGEFSPDLTDIITIFRKTAEQWAIFANKKSIAARLLTGFQNTFIKKIYEYKMEGNISGADYEIHPKR